MNHVVDEPIFDIVLNRLILPDYADRVAAELETNRSDALEAAARHRASRERLEKEIENLQMSFAHVTHPDDIASINEQLTRRREQLEQLAAEAESMIVAQQVMSEKDIGSTHICGIEIALLPVLIALLIKSGTPTLFLGAF